MGLYCFPSDIRTDQASSVIWQAGLADANYPVANVKDRRADTVAKVTGANGTLRATFAAPQALEGVVLVNTNATAAVVTNGSGLNQAFSIPALPMDNLRLDPWLDLRSILLATRTSTQWDIALTGPGPTSIGELLLVQTWRTIPLLWGLTEKEMHRAEILTTDYGVRRKWAKGVRQRSVVGRIIAEENRAEITALVRDARGPVRNFALILEETVNDALYVDLTVEEVSWTRDAPLASTWELTFTEQQKGMG